MQETLINHPRLRVTRKTGAEGPRHDPYHYDEYTAATPAGVAQLHMGLCSWVRLDGEHHTNEMWGNDGKTEDAEVVYRFEQFVGFTLSQIERIHRKLNSRCRQCGCRSFHSESGYPGETLTVCDDCGHIQDSCFDISAIE